MIIVVIQCLTPLLPSCPPALPTAPSPGQGASQGTALYRREGLRTAGRQEQGNYVLREEKVREGVEEMREGVEEMREGKVEEEDVRRLRGGTKSGRQRRMWISRISRMSRMGRK